MLQGAVSWIAVGWSVGRLVSRTERRAKAGRVPAMFAQGGVDERQQVSAVCSRVPRAASLES